MASLNNTTVHEYFGVLVEVLEEVQGQLGGGIILQATDEQEYVILDGYHMIPFLRQRVRIAGRLHQIGKKKSLEVLEINQIQLNGTLQ